MGLGVFIDFSLKKGRGIELNKQLMEKYFDHSRAKQK